MKLTVFTWQEIHRQVCDNLWNMLHSSIKVCDISEISFFYMSRNLKNKFVTWCNIGCISFWDRPRWTLIHVNLLRHGNGNVDDRRWVRTYNEATMLFSQPAHVPVHRMEICQCSFISHKIWRPLPRQVSQIPSTAVQTQYRNIMCSYKRKHCDRIKWSGRIISIRWKNTPSSTQSQQLQTEAN